MADPMGTRASNYDLAVDLAGLWKESQNVIDAMMNVPEPEVPVCLATEDGFEMQYQTSEQTRQAAVAPRNASPVGANSAGDSAGIDGTTPVGNLE